MILADAHLHLFRSGYSGVYGESLLRPDVEVYETLRGVHGIAAGLVVGYQGEGIDPRNNTYIRELAAERPWMRTLAYVDAHSSPSPDMLRSILESGHAGIALYATDPTAAAAASGWNASAWSVLHQGGAIVSLNAGPASLPLLSPVMRDFPGCMFLVSHMGLPGSYRVRPGMAAAKERLTSLLRLAALPNAFVKISAPYAISDPAYAYPHVAAEPFLDLILERFGVERCVWGSDFSPALDHVSFAQTVTYPWLDRLPDADRALVMGQNLLRLLNLAEAWPPPVADGIGGDS